MKQINNPLILTTMNAKKDWLGTYSTTPVKKFQAGGAMSYQDGGAAPAGPEAGAPAGAPAGGGDIESMIAEYAQTRDPQLAVAICDMIVEMMAQGQGGAGAPAGPEAGAAPAGGAPAARNGMKLVRGPIFKK